MLCNRKNIGCIFLVTSYLSACGGGGGGNGGDGNAATNTPSAPEIDVAPTVNAGADQVVDELTDVTLTGSAADSDGTINAYSWALTSTGTTVTLTGSDTATATFNAPELTSDQVLTFSLTVTDNHGATSSDTMSVTIHNISSPPAGEMTVPEGDTFILQAEPLSSATFWEGNGSQPVGSTTIVNVEHEQFSQALEVNITNPSSVTWNGSIKRVPVLLVCYCRVLNLNM
jgi:hypothetical protein